MNSKKNRKLPSGTKWVCRGYCSISVIADNAYDSDKTLDKIAQMEATAVIPPKSNRKEQREYDKHHYKDRNLIERFFCRLKQFRGIATRYCKRGQYFLEAIKLASSVILMC